MVKKTGCHGFCEQGPILVIDPANILYCHVTAEDIPEIVDKTLGEISYGFADAIPVGVSWRTDSGDGVRHAAGLNPGPDYEIADDEKVVMLARGREPRYRGLARPAEPASERKHWVCAT